jgi:signal transduction histidine kinase
VSIAHIYQYVSTDQHRLRSLTSDILALDGTDLPQILNQAAALIRDATGAHSVAVLLWDADVGGLRIAGSAPQTSAEQQAERYDEHRARSRLNIPFVVSDGRRGVARIVMNQAHSGDHMLPTLKAAAHAVGTLTARIERIALMLDEAAQQGRTRLIEDLASTLNHDLRNMMAPIMGRLDLIRRQAIREGNEKYVRHAEAATEATRRILAVLQNLVDVGKLEQGTLPLQRHDVNLTELVRNIVADVSNTPVPIEVKTTGDVHAVGDIERLRQTLEYMITNAVRYSLEDQTVVVRITRIEEGEAIYAIVSVCDQGVRIPPDVLPQIWTRYTIGRGSMGFNLGLYLAQTVAKAHGGTLRVTSDEPGGTTWSLLLPIAE